MPKVKNLSDTVPPLPRPPKIISISAPSSPLKNHEPLSQFIRNDFLPFIEFFENGCLNDDSHIIYSALKEGKKIDASMAKLGYQINASSGTGFAGFYVSSRIERLELRSENFKNIDDWVSESRRLFREFNAGFSTHQNKLFELSGLVLTLKPDDEMVVNNGKSRIRYSYLGFPLVAYVVDGISGRYTVRGDAQAYSGTVLLDSASYYSTQMEKESPYLAGVPQIILGKISGIGLNLPDLFSKLVHESRHLFNDENWEVGAFFIKGGERVHSIISKVMDLENVDWCTASTLFKNWAEALSYLSEIIDGPLPKVRIMSILQESKDKLNGISDAHVLGMRKTVRMLAGHFSKFYSTSESEAMLDIENIFSNTSESGLRNTAYQQQVRIYSEYFKFTGSNAV